MTLRAAAPVLAAAALLLTGCGGSETTTQPLLAPTIGAPERTTAAAGTTAAEPVLHHVCEGAGSPAVILEAGLGSPSDGWQDLQRLLAETTRTCRYDRAGLGLSRSSDDGGRTAAAHVRELRSLLEEAGIEPPYVLVGHSYGGAIARLFAHTHRDLAAGAVFLDTPHPDERDRYLAALPPDDDPVLDRLRAQLAAVQDPAANPERLDWDRAMAEVRGANTLGNLPLVVVTAGRAGPRTVQGLPERLVKPLEDTRMELQRELAGLSTDSVHVVAADSGHAVPDAATGQPDVVVTAVEAVVRAARDGTTLPPCGTLFPPPRTRCVAAG